MKQFYSGQTHAQRKPVLVRMAVPFTTYLLRWVASMPYLLATVLITISLSVSSLAQTLPVVTGTTCENGKATLMAQAPGIIHWYNSPVATTPLYTGSSFTTPPLSSPAKYYVSSEVNSKHSERLEVSVTVANTPQTKLVLTDCVVDLYGYISSLLTKVNGLSKPFNQRTNTERIPCPGDRGVGENTLNIFSYVGPLNKSCNRVLNDDCNDPNRQNYWLSVLDDRRSATSNVFGIGSLVERFT